MNNTSSYAKFLNSIVMFGVCVMFFLNSCTSDTESNKQQTQHFPKHVQYIAHAGGCVNGYKYTNSLEAVENAINCGIRFIELDLLMTSDNKLVTGHDWEFFRQATNREPSTEPLSFAEYRKKKIYDTLTPITMDILDSLMTVHPDIYIVTDKISDPDILEKFLGKYRSRIMVECFETLSYSRLNKMGFYKVFYSSVPPAKYGISGITMRKLFNNFAFGYFGSIWTPYVAYDYSSAYGDEFAVFTVKNRYEADSLAAIDPRINYVYIDYVE